MESAHSFFEVDSKMEALAARLARYSDNVLDDFKEKLLISWIYHDNALEGVVLSYHELKAAIDDRIISDNTLIPLYDEIRAHKLAIDFIRVQSGKKRSLITLDGIKKIHQILTLEDDGKQAHYRKDNPLHRVYFHEIAPPEKISYRMRKLVEWLKSDEFKASHPVKRAAQAHQTLISIYPWMKNSGKVARLLMNLLLLKDGYMPAVVHAVDRQRYYDVLRAPSAADLAHLVKEALDNSIESAVRYLAEFAGRWAQVA